MGEEWTIEKFKELFLEVGKLYCGGRTPNVPSDKLLRLGVRAVDHLQSKKESVEIHVGGGSLWIRAPVSDIGIEISPEGYFRMWIEQEDPHNCELRKIWRGEFGNLIRGVLGYKEVMIGEDDDDFNFLNPEQPIDRFLLISAKFAVKFRKLKEVLDEFEAERDKLYTGIQTKIPEILK